MAREFRFPVEVAWQGGRLTSARVDGKPAIGIATPPEFRGSNPDVWSPEDFFVAAAASCLTVSIVSIAEYEGLPLLSLSVGAEGVVGRPEGGGALRFTKIEQRVELETEVGSEAEAERIVKRAEETCLVAVSLALSVETTVVVHSPAAA